MDIDFIFFALGLAALFAGFVDSIVGGGGLTEHQHEQGAGHAAEP